MTKPETKTVLGRVFTREGTIWRCLLGRSRELRVRTFGNVVEAALVVHGCVWTSEAAKVQAWLGSEEEAEKAAILALQATLRKMAELEAV